MSTTNSQNVFTGFSTTGSSSSKNWTFYDIDLIKKDLMNHFNTRVGERVMRPDFGCKIWDYMMEPLTSAMKDLVRNEAVRVCEYDSRVSVSSVKVYSAGSGIRIELTLTFNPFATVDSLIVNFEAPQDNRLGFK